jgi:hypothetical protein
MDTTETTARRGAVVALWTAAVLFAILAVVRIALHGDFSSASGEGCKSEQNPEWVAACEQFGPISWFGPYWLAIVVFAIFAAWFATLAVKTARGRSGAGRSARVATIAAIVLAVIPGVFDLGWRVAIATSNEADKWVAEYVRDAEPFWYGPFETAVLILAAAAAILGAEWLRRTAEPA